MKKPICIMAGGTGGHIFPGLAVAEELIKRGETVHWIGSKHGLEGRLVPEQGIPMHYLAVRALRGSPACNASRDRCGLVFHFFRH